MPAYSERTRRIEFPELGDDIWVDVRNPLLLPMEPEAWDALKPRQRAFARLQRWIAAWNVPDPDTGDLLGPASNETLAKAPSAILDKVATEAMGWSNPLGRTPDNSSTETPSNTSSSSSPEPPPETSETSPPSSSTSA